MGIMGRPRAPEGLDKAGRAFWLSVTRTYELAPAELAGLRRCCVTLDTLAAMDAEIAEQGLSVKGSRGQVIPNRMIKLRCECERVLDVQVRALNLPMPGEDTGRRRSPAAAAAAYTRWAQHG
jgi:phage terminase small subunit